MSHADSYAEEKVSNHLKLKCVEQISSGLTKDLEAAYIQAFALLQIADELADLPGRFVEVQQAAKQTEDARTKKGKS